MFVFDGLRVHLQKSKKNQKLVRIDFWLITAGSSATNDSDLGPSPPCHVIYFLTACEIHLGSRQYIHKIYLYDYIYIYKTYIFTFASAIFLPMWSLSSKICLSL